MIDLSPAEFAKVLVSLEIADYSAVSGAYIWSPYGVSLMEQIHKKLSILTPEYSKIYIPTLLSAEDSAKEPHGHRILKQASFSCSDEKIFLKPTSQMVLYPYLVKKIKSWRHLPCKVYAINPVFRKENSVALLLRCQEITGFYQKHALFASESETCAEIEKLEVIYSELFKSLRIPCLKISRYIDDCFPNAVSSTAFDTFIGGKRLQIGTVHNLGVNFSIPLGMKFKNIENAQKYPYICCAGISQRVLFAFVYYNLEERDSSYILNIPSGFRDTVAILDPKSTPPDKLRQIPEEYSFIRRNISCCEGVESSDIKSLLKKGYRYVIRLAQDKIKLTDNYLSESKIFNSFEEIELYVKKSESTLETGQIKIDEVFFSDLLKQNIKKDITIGKIRFSSKDDEDSLSLLKSALLKAENKLKTIFGYDAKGFVYFGNSY